MKKVWIKFEIRVNNDYCDKSCKYLMKKDDGVFHYFCSLFREGLVFMNERIQRCSQCCEAEKRSEQNEEKD